MKSTVGRIVHYQLSDHDAFVINKRREDAMAHMGEHRDNSNGVVVHVGNPAVAGEIYPMIVTRVSRNHDGIINGQVLLDGSDTLWVTSAPEGEGNDHWCWPPRVGA